jgi:hypothetical protein
MTSPVITTKSDIDIYDAHQYFIVHHIHRLKL